MGYDVVILMSIIIIFLVMLALTIFITLMSIQKKKTNKNNFPKCPEMIFNRYLIWYSSFTWWTIIEYFLMLIPLFTSIATIYFTMDLLTAQQDNNNSAILLTTMSFVSALLPMINSKILPKTHADGFYKGLTLIEQGMLRHNEGIITTKELIEIAERAEKCTNPMAYNDNQ